MTICQSTISTAPSAATPTFASLSDDQLGDGYGRPTAAAIEATRLLARTEGILVDPIYTAKALAGLVARVRDRRLRGPVVFWHAGGLPGLFEPL
jgi:1-aminocyclopropane-1-carboxylate deaminase/D-cysteine desulfhydrase-like pyridoxal-dependent ACC family enzyme